MNFDLARIAEQVNAFWHDHATGVIVGVGLLALALAVYGLVRFARSHQRSRWVSVLAALVALAWTSEGLWEVARYTLGLPVGFAAFTFFVFEAMMLSAALQAEEHRRRHGAPGAAGRYVWVLALLTATVVALNASTGVEAVLRFAVPLAVAGLWWVSVTAERDSDTNEVRQRREQAAAAREATWTVTPSTVLVRLGLRRPGAQTMTEAERAYRRRRMVVHADRLAAAGSKPAARWSAYRLRRLARQATAEDVAVVREQVHRAAGIVATVLAPAPPADMSPSTEGDIGGDMSARTSPRTSAPMSARRSGRTRGGQAGAVADRIAAVLAQHPDISRAELARQAGTSPRHVRRVLGDMSAHRTRSGADTGGDIDQDGPADMSAPLSALNGRR
jgi:hypothetical protein